MHATDRVIERDGPAIRAKLLEIAAALDRYDRAAGGEREVHDDPRLERVFEALEVLITRHDRPNRAEQVQRIFSLPAE